MSAPHVQRCTELRRFGDARHGRLWQCLHQDPHPATGHDFGTDAEVFGRELDTQRPEWLAAQLRVRVAREKHLQRRLEEQQAIALHLAQLAAFGTPLPASTGRWLAANAPSAAAALGVHP